jgi:hypothetical protein
LPEPEFELVAGRSHIFDFDIYALLRMVQGTEDGNLLFETPWTASGATIYD